MAAVLFVDLDRFKDINDSLGHSAGDVLLQEVAERLLLCTRSNDTVARIGGDEFAIILEQILVPGHAASVAEKVGKLFSRPFMLQQREVYVTASIGISLFPRDGEDAETLLRNADAAMYKAKADGRNTHHFYTGELTKNAFERIYLESSLHQALQKQEFELYYQPQVDLEQNRIIGIEVLLRWRHPTLGLLQPARFIHLAAENGLIAPIGNWVLNQACQQARRWLDAGFEFNRVAVNVSGAQVQQKTLTQEIARALDKAQLTADHLELEITEDFMIGHEAKFIHYLQELRTLGVNLAIDDFGVGYSSLNHLKQLPVQTLKIDRSFIHDIPHDNNDAAITRAIIALGRSLDLQVIAEGVETAEQALFLQQEGCHLVQGHLYSHPQPASQLEPWLQAWQARSDQEK
jgi:diguanylate cyclase (GGDEF)-like protein